MPKPIHFMSTLEIQQLAARYEGQQVHIATMPAHTERANKGIAPAGIPLAHVGTIQSFGLRGEWPTRTVSHYLVLNVGKGLKPMEIPETNISAIRLHTEPKRITFTVNGVTVNG